jgi:hypothetical protein
MARVATASLILRLVAVRFLMYAVNAQSATPSPSSYGVCKGNNVAFRFNTRPNFIVAVASPSTGTSATLELRLCIGASTSVANVGLRSLTLDVSSDGELVVWTLALFVLCLLAFLSSG